MKKETTRTEPLPRAAAARVDDTLPDVGQPVVPTVRSKPARGAGGTAAPEASANAEAPTTADAPLPARRWTSRTSSKNMKGAQMWSPPAETSAESKGADFVAYQAVAAAVKAHDASLAGERVVLDITSPSPPDELAALVQDAQRIAPPPDGSNDVTLVRARSVRRRIFAVAGLALVFAFLVGVAVWRIQAGRAEASAAPPVLAPPSIAPAASASPPAESLPVPVATPVASSSSPPAVRAVPARAPSPRAPPSAPAIIPPPPASVPHKNDLPWTL